MTLAMGFRSPNPTKHDRGAYERYIEEKLPPESPQMFGLHPNAEIGYLTTLGDTLFLTILQCSGGGGGGGSSKKDDVIKGLIIRFSDQLPANFNMIEVSTRAKEKTPYVVV